MNYEEVLALVLDKRYGNVRELVKNLYNHRENSCDIGKILWGADVASSKAVAAVVADYAANGENGWTPALFRAMDDAGLL